MLLIECTLELWNNFSFRITEVDERLHLIEKENKDLMNVNIINKNKYSNEITHLVDKVKRIKDTTNEQKGEILMLKESDNEFNI